MERHAEVKLKNKSWINDRILKTIKTRNKLFACKKKDNQTMQTLPNSIICLETELIEKLDNRRKTIIIVISISILMKLRKCGKV